MYGRMKLACEAAGAATAAALLAGKVELERGQHGRRGRLRRQRGCANGRCYPGRAMKTGIHPEYVVAHRALLLRQRIRHALDEAGAARRGVLELPPVLHGQAEADGYRRPRRALPAPAREGRRGPAPALARDTHGSQLRRPGRPRGRDDARPVQLVGRRAQARRRDRPRLAPHRFADEAARATRVCRSSAASSRSASRSRSASARSRSPRTTRRRRKTARGRRLARSFRAASCSSPLPSRSASRSRCSR